MFTETRDGNLMRITLLSIVAVCSLAAAALAQPVAVVADPARPFEGHVVVKITPRTPAELLAISTVAESVWSCNIGVGPIEVQVSPVQRAAIDQMDIPYEVWIADVQALVDREQGDIAAARARELDAAGAGGFGQRDDAWFTSYHDFVGIQAKLNEWAATYPSMVTTLSAGNSIQGRPLSGVRIRTADQPGNPALARPMVLFAGGQHAREWVNPATVMYIADRLLREYGTNERSTRILNTTEILIVPVQNPDGYAWTWASASNRLWRKNRRENAGGTIGVDLNRNWGYEWGGLGASATPGNDTYRGTSGFSEPETAAMRDFMAANPRLRAHIDFHSYSQLILSPWAYTGALPPDATLFDRINASMAEGIFSVYGKTYVAGPIFSTIYPASGGAVDWAFGNSGILSFTIELRDLGQFGFLLPADQILPTVEENFEAAARLAEFVSLPLLLSQDPAPPSLIPAEQFTSVGVRVKAGTTQLGLANPVVISRVASSEPWTVIPTAASGGGLFQASLPAGVCGQNVEWYFEAVAADGRVVRLPEDAPVTTFSVPVVGEYVTFADSMETDLGWSVGQPSDAAVRGVWERADPEATAAQPGDDATPTGTLCWVTQAAAGAGVGTFDIDGGSTTLTSPIFSALPPVALRSPETFVQYARWFSNNQGANPNVDTLRVEYSADGGAVWSQLEVVSNSSGVWNTLTYRIDLLRAPTSTMRLRFIASDLEPGSIVEAGLDDVRIFVRGCPFTADFDADGDVDSDDIIRFFAAWDGGEGSADYDNSDSTDSDDVIAFFTLWEEGR